MQLNGANCLALVDTGADRTIVRQDILPKDINLLPVGSKVKLADNGHCTNIIGSALISCELGKFKKSVCVLVASALCEPCLLGVDVLWEAKAVVNMSEGIINISGDNIRLETQGDGSGTDILQVGRVLIAETFVVQAGSEVILPGKVVMKKQCSCRVPDTSSEVFGVVDKDEGFVDRTELCVARLAVQVHDDTVPVRMSNLTECDVTVYKDTHVGDFEQVDDSSFMVDIGSVSVTTVEESVSHLQEPERSKFRDLLLKYQDLFSGLGRTTVTEHTIPTGANRPVFQNPRPTPGHLTGLVKQQLDELVEDGVIEPVSQSQWASPLVLVKRPHGGQVRICGDFRKVNKVTTPSVQVIPRIDSSLQKLSGAEWFTSIDLVQAYHQLPVKEADREKTTIATEFGLYRYVTAPYGLCGLPHTFNRALSLVLAGVSPAIYVQYFDDILVMSRDLPEMRRNLEIVLAALQSAGLTLSLKKLRLCQRKVQFLGFSVSAGGIECDPEKVRIIQEWHTPTTVKEVRVFLGLCGYLRRHISGYATLVKPLTKLTEKHRPFCWGDEQERAFQCLKDKLSSPPVLAFPVFEDDAPLFVLDTDASGTGLGACLLQGERVVAYGSKALSKAERQYSVTKRELLAIVWATQHFRQYLVGRRFILRTDHAALQWLFNFKDPEGQLARWLLQLSELEFDVQHRKGTLHSDGDALSRYPHRQTDSEEMYRWVCLPVRQDSESLQSGMREPTGPSRPQESVEEPVRLCAAVDEQAASCGVAGLSVDDFSREQDRDESIRELKAWKARKVRPEGKHLKAADAPQLLREWRRLVVKGDDHPVLYRRMQPQRNEPACLQIVVPSHLRRETLEMCHEGIGGGHQGSAKLEIQVRRRFFWPGLQADVKNFCKQCLECELRKDPPRHPRAPLGSLQSGAFLDRLDIDLVTGLPSSEPEGYRYVLTCIDSFTRFVWAFPLKTQEDTEIVRGLMDQVVCLFGIPKTIHSDQGKNFVGKVASQLYQSLGIHQSTTTAYHPQGNAYCERSHRTLMDIVSKMCRERQRQWPRYLAAAVLAINANTSESTGQATHAPPRPAVPRGQCGGSTSHRDGSGHVGLPGQVTGYPYTDRSAAPRGQRRCPRAGQTAARCSNRRERVRCR